VRRALYERYGGKGLYDGGLSVRTALDPQLQEMAKKALTAGLVKFDEARGWRGAIKRIELGGDWGPELAKVQPYGDISWTLAVVLSTEGEGVQIGLEPGHEASGAVKPARITGTITPEGMKWARWAKGADQPEGQKGPLGVGDVVYVDPATDKDGKV